jgi:hypothetical protein
MSNAQQNCRGWRREEGVEGKGAGGGKGGVMTQSLYAHMNKGKKNFFKCSTNLQFIGFENPRVYVLY